MPWMAGIDSEHDNIMEINGDTFNLVKVFRYSCWPKCGHCLHSVTVCLFYRMQATI